MAVEQKRPGHRIIVVEPGSELDRALDAVDDTPILLERDGVRYRVQRQPEGLIDPRNPGGLQEALRQSFGAMAGTFTEEFRRELREQGEQDSHGRPAV